MSSTKTVNLRDFVKNRTRKNNKYKKTSFLYEEKNTRKTMEKIKKNTQLIVESWTPAIKSILGDQVFEGLQKNTDRLSWMCEVAHTQRMDAINESAEAIGGVGLPHANLNTVLGIGNAVPPQIAASTAAEQSGKANVGSGDKWPVTLPIAMQVAARTIAFDLVNVHPLEGPTGVLPFVDYVYSDTQQPYGATPAYSAETANPKIGVGGKEKPWRNYGLPSTFQAKMVIDSSAAVTKIKASYGLRKAESITLSAEAGDVKVEFIGLSRLTAMPMFRVLEGEISLGQLFEEGELVVDQTFVTKDGDEFKITLSAPQTVSLLENHILGYTGSGRYDSDRWSGTYQDPFHLYEPMDRATGERQMPRHLSLQLFTKFFEVGKIQATVNVTREQITDSQKQWGLDVLKLVENALVNELSQTINKHILSRLFALGWRNHLEAYDAEGINLNISLGDATKIGFATYKDGEEIKPEDAEMEVPAMADYGAFENMDTKFSRILKLVMTAGNVIMQRGRRGPATFAVANYKIATLLQSAAQYTFAPIANTFNQNNGSLYPLGNISGITVYVDPYMRWDDTRILVGRKGTKDDPGVYFCPYLMAESVQFISPATFAPQVVVQSRYALVDAGWFPETLYLTLFVNAPGNLF